MRPEPPTGEARGLPRCRRDDHGGNAHRGFPSGHIQGDKKRYTNGHGCWNGHTRNRMPSTSMRLVKFETPNHSDTVYVSDQFQRCTGQPNYYDTVADQFQRRITYQASSSSAYMNHDKRSWSWHISPGKDSTKSNAEKVVSP